MAAARTCTSDWDRFMCRHGTGFVFRTMCRKCSFQYSPPLAPCSPKVYVREISGWMHDLRRRRRP
jgi:hypothetical protein